MHQMIKMKQCLQLDLLAQEIEAYTELKESLPRYLDNPDMERYTAKELNELRYEHRKLPGFSVYFMEEFDRCLDQTQAFFAL